jgi:hypothetical protein
MSSDTVFLFFLLESILVFERLYELIDTYRFSLIFVRAPRGLFLSDEHLMQSFLELLKTHDLLFKSVNCDQSMNSDCFALANSMRSVHCLDVLHRVPVMLHEDDCISASQVQP